MKMQIDGLTHDYKVQLINLDLADYNEILG